ncbi:hypothetical protein [Streptosporangium sp. G12]
MRIQILPLPRAVVGEVSTQPFALIVDQYDAPTTEKEFDRWNHFKQGCGAEAVLVTPETVEVVDRHAVTAEDSDAERDLVALADFLVASYDVPRDLFDSKHTPARIAVSLLLLHAMFGGTDEVKAAFAKSLPSLREQKP